MTLARLALLLSITACTQHADGTCIWVPGDDGSCGSRDGGGGGGGSSPPPKEYVRYPSATVVTVGSTAWVFALQIDDRTDDFITHGAMRELGLPDNLSHWTLDVQRPTNIASWSGGDRALLRVTDQTGIRAVEIDERANVISSTYLSEPFTEAMRDERGWWLLEPAYHALAIRRIGGEPIEIATVGDTAWIETPTIGNGLVAWREKTDPSDPYRATAHVYRIADGVRGVFEQTWGYQISDIGLVPDRDDAIWLGNGTAGEIITFGEDPLSPAQEVTFVEQFRDRIGQAPPDVMIATASGYAGYRASEIIVYEGSIATENFRRPRSVPGDPTGIAAFGSDFVVMSDDESEIYATLPDEDGELDAVVLLETYEYSGGCSAGGSGGSLLLVGLALLLSRRVAHPARSSRRIAR